jgi:sugar phosphate permease
MGRYVSPQHHPTVWPAIATHQSHVSPSFKDLANWFPGKGWGEFNRAVRASRKIGPHIDIVITPISITLYVLIRIYHQSGVSVRKFSIMFLFHLRKTNTMLPNVTTTTTHDQGNRYLQYRTRRFLQGAG